MTPTDVLEINNMAMNDLCYNNCFDEIIEIKQDINLACKKLLITQPINVNEAKKISHYLNRIYNNE